MIRGPIEAMAVTLVASKPARSYQPATVISTTQNYVYIASFYSYLSSVDTARIARELRSAIDELRTERDEINNQIGAMEQALRELGVKRGPGRPRGSGKKNGASASPSSATKKKAVRNWTPEAREAARERMRKYWANKKRAERRG